MDNDFFKNFALSMPTKALSHKSGKPMLYVPPELKAMFIEYCNANNITDENTTHEQRDEIYKTERKTHRSLACGM